MEPHLEPQQLAHTGDISNRMSKWDSAKPMPVKIKIAIYKWMHRKAIRKALRDAKRKLDDDSGRTGQLELSEVTISSQTEIGQTEVSIKIPAQRAYTGRKPAISSSLADIPCCCLGIQGLLNLLNSTLGTSYTVIAKNYDFGTAYGRLCETWYRNISDIQKERQECEAGDVKMRKDALDGGRIVQPSLIPRRTWDLYSNRVVPWWCCGVGYPHPISHAWVDEEDRVDVWTPINGYEWPMPIPKGANLNLIRIEMLNLGVEYTWLDVLCLRQRGGLREDLRVEEWKLDEGDLESDRCWFRRAWTVQEVSWAMPIAGDTLNGTLHAKPIDKKGNYEDKMLTIFHKQLKSTRSIYGLYGALSAMQGRISTYPVDRVVGLTYSLGTDSIPAYYESQSLEDAWTTLMRGELFFTYPGPGPGCKKWRPLWGQVMEKPLPKYIGSRLAIPHVERNDEDWFEGRCIERGYVRGLAVGGEEGFKRRGELVVEDTDGITHAFRIAASHQHPIPEDTYTLLGSHPYSDLQYWIVGRRLPNEMFEKVSVFQIADPDERKQLGELGLATKSRSILA
ncbi:hypothetical protein EDD18DRAFT_1332883 [Armillaria luteobubalina]|uniref:Heterokaryon incompatibility domain-containing protein n=1 Tax=Armillaria luteobubalina TaxID=153913 RepID=A0AA39UVR9_9AGAR|nr:hypothetical protein EDD18DRAFT_1332883 [Armillaria luteobubalina]